MYEVIFLVDSGIGNAIQTLYAVEYLLQQNVKVGFYLGRINNSFQNYLRTCYGKVILNSIEDKETEVLIHGFTYQNKEMPYYKKYIYISADYHSTRHRTETEQFLDVVKSLFPSDYHSLTLTHLKEDFSERVQSLVVENKTVFYPGCNSISPAKRWPHFPLLMQNIGKEKVIIVGGKEDLDFSYSYYYPKWLSMVVHQKLMNKKFFWVFCKKLEILKTFSHWNELEVMENAFINVFTWEELVSIFRRCNHFVGNDGGLTHLAAASGSNGIVLFGPTSIKKNKTFNTKIKVLFNSCCCSQFGEEGKVLLSRGYINCPCQVKCLSKISKKEVEDELKRKDQYQKNIV